ncbi:MAG: HAMP domain-containing histidine kinase [Tatlockia sp.]|nr:HAMP domain-containing histidine kinase [Tatlockia sp.]
MFAMFMFGLKWQIQYFSVNGIFQSIDTVLEVIGFSMATICLSRAQTFLMKCSSIGYLLIIASDFIIRYHVISGLLPYLSSLESTWILGLLLMSLGFYSVKNSSDKRLFKISAINSLQSQIGIWLLVLWLLSVFMFAGTYYFFSPSTEPYLNHFTKNFLSMLVPFSVLAIVSSSYIAIKISSPLAKLESKINEFLLTEVPPEEITNLIDNNYISEFKALDKLVFNAFSLYQKKYITDMNFAKLAAQVTHDIRSPLAAINTALSDLTSVPENKRVMIRNAANRINDIANNLLFKANNNFINSQENLEGNANSAELIFFVLENIVGEKRYEHHESKVHINLNGSEDSYNCFSKIHLETFKRVLSNLINNSIEASKSKGLVELTLASNDSHIEIIIKDNGCGIPKDILPKVKEQGFSFNKKNGAGLGLSYAEQYLRQMNGKMYIHSEEKIGTSIKIELPKADQPDWFCDSLTISQGSQVVVLDDDPSIHDVWNERFAALSSAQLIHCYTLSELILYKVDSERPILYLIDYELLSDLENGLDIIEKLQINDKALLVTSCFEDVAIRDRCTNLGVSMIPKPYVPHLKIKQTSFSNLVFIDDDEMMRNTWLFAAEEVGMSITTYSSFNEFLKNKTHYDKDTVIYIDSDLGDNIKGVLCAKRLFNEGFKEVHLTTGYSHDRFGNMPWLKSIVGKEPPFY